MKVSAFLVLAASLAVAAGCSRPHADLSDTELADGVYECRTKVDQSPGFAIRCDNYKRECEARRAEGRYVC